MSQKITAKNLQYNSSLPPFLARLRGQEADSRANGGPDPILASQRRIGKPRSASAEAEDAPLVVDERGEVVDLAAMNGDNDASQEKETEQAEGDKSGQETGGDTAKDKKEDGDLTKSKKKRKLGKVIGAGDEDDEDENENEKGNKGKLQNLKTKSERIETGASKKEGAGGKKKKAKKIKLSFGDDEEEG